MALQPTWALSSSILRLQASLSSAHNLQSLHINTPLTTQITTNNHLPLGLPTSLLPSMSPSSASLGTPVPFIVITWPSHHSLLNLIFTINFVSLYKVKISWFRLFHHYLSTNTVHRTFLWFSVNCGGHLAELRILKKDSSSVQLLVTQEWIPRSNIPYVITTKSETIIGCW